MVPQRRPDRLRRSHDWPRAALLAGALLLTATIGIAFAGGAVAASASAIGSEQPFAQQNDTTTDSGVQDDVNDSDETDAGEDADSSEEEAEDATDTSDGESADEQDGDTEESADSADETDGDEGAPVEDDGSGESSDSDGDESADDGESAADDEAEADDGETEADDSDADDGDTSESETDESVDDVDEEDAESSQDDANTITECTAIEEPGTYELAEDLEAQSGRTVDVGGGVTKDVCIGIRASGVTLNGNGHVIEGTGASQSVGVQVFATDSGSVDDVTVRNLRVENWYNGIEIGFSSWYLLEDRPATATVEDVTTTSNGYHGVYVAAGSGTDFDGVTASDNAEAGFGLFDAESVTMTDSTARNNGEHGVALFEGVFDSEFSDIDATNNGGAGVYLGRETSGNTFSDVRVTGNDGSGIEGADGEQNEIQDATVEGNG